MGKGKKMSVSLIIMIVAYVIYAIAVVWALLRQKSFLKKAGKAEALMLKDNSYRTVVILIFGLALIFIACKLKYSFFIQGVLCGCGILAAVICIRDADFFKIRGVYENGFIIEGSYIAYEEILSFPAETGNADKKVTYAENVLVIATKKRDNHTINLRSAEECKLLRSYIKKFGKK